MIQVFIQVEAGSKEKHMYDERTLDYIGSKSLSEEYPFPYGFILNTENEDGESVDCYVITKRKLESGSVVECEPQALVEQYENGEVDHKVLAIFPDENTNINQSVNDVLRKFIQQVFLPFPEVRVEVGNLLDR